MSGGSNPIDVAAGARTWSMAGGGAAADPRTSEESARDDARRMQHWDRELVSRVCAGDSVAFDELYDAYHDRVYRYVASRVRDRAEAEDLTQDTFVEAYRSMASFEGRSSLASWLIGIARFVCFRFRRFSSRWMIGPEPGRIARDFSVDDPVEARVDAIRALERCDAFLAEKYGEPNRAIFRLRYGEARSIRFIASAVGRSEDAVKACLRRSRRALEPELCGLGNGSGSRAPLST